MVKSHIKQHPKFYEVQFRRVFKYSCLTCKTTPEKATEKLGKYLRRTKNEKEARFISYYAFFEKFQKYISTTELGAYLLQDHSTTLHAMTRVSEWIDTDKKFKARYKKVKVYIDEKTFLEPKKISKEKDFNFDRDIISLKGILNIHQKIELNVITANLKKNKYSNILH